MRMIMYYETVRNCHSLKMTAKRALRYYMIFAAVIVCMGCNRDTAGEILKEIDVSEVEAVECFGSTGGQNGEFGYELSHEYIAGFIELIQKAELGEEVSEDQAFSVGAIVYYIIHFQDGNSVEISPGDYFMVEDKYYVFENRDELWDSFVKYNSKFEIISMIQSGAPLQRLPSNLSLSHTIMISGWTMVSGLSASFTSNGAGNTWQSPFFCRK